MIDDGILGKMLTLCLERFIEERNLLNAIVFEFAGFSTLISVVKRPETGRWSENLLSPRE